MEDSPSGKGSGNVSTNEIVMDCGIKQIHITLNLSDVPGVVPTSVNVRERLKDK
jgi:hypothetical protein